MSFEQIVNSGLDRAELVSSSIDITDDEKTYFIRVQDLLSDAKFDITWSLVIRENEEMTDESVAYLILRHANETLEEFRSEG